MAFVVAASMFALPQKSLSAKDAKAGFEKAPVAKTLKAKVQQTNQEKLSVRDFVPAELKAEKDAVEKRLSATIAEKDSIIKDQSAQLAQLAQQVAQIADKALITTAQQQYLTAKAGGDAVEITPAEEVPVVEQPPEKKKKGFWGRLFGG